jgi:guanylate kinase
MTRVFVITGPSGVGKGTLIAALRERHPELELSVSATTRPPRPGEQDGVAYHFLSEDEFDRRLARGEFVEHAELRRASLRHAARRARASQPRRHAGGARDRAAGGAPGPRRDARGRGEIFIAPRSLEQLRERLAGTRRRGARRRSQRRLAIAETELAAREEFGFVVVNDELERAVAELEAIYLQLH